MKSHRGMALITVLIFMQILAVLGIFALQMAWIETKVAQHKWQKYILMAISESILREVEQKFTDGQLTNCIIAPLSTRQLINKSLTWWQSIPSCSGSVQQFDYYYVIESLGIDPCAYLQLNPKKQIASYSRINLMVMDNVAKTLLQSTVITPITEQEGGDCNHVSHQVVNGRQMTRELFSSG